MGEKRSSALEEMKATKRVPAQKGLEGLELGNGMERELSTSTPASRYILSDRFDHDHIFRIRRHPSQTGILCWPIRRHLTLDARECLGWTWHNSSLLSQDCACCSVFGLVIERVGSGTVHGNGESNAQSESKASEMVRGEGGLSRYGRWSQRLMSENLLQTSRETDEDGRSLFQTHKFGKCD